MSTFIQPRDRRTNLKRDRIDTKSTMERKETKEEEYSLEKIENDDRDMEKSWHISENDPDHRVNQGISLINDEEEVGTQR